MCRVGKNLEIFELFLNVSKPKNYLEGFWSCRVVELECLQFQQHYTTQKHLQKVQKINLKGFCSCGFEDSLNLTYGDFSVEL